MGTFVEKLLRAGRANGSLLCVGLDPDPDLIPSGVALDDFNRAIIDATKDLVCAFKPNLAFYEQYGMEGLNALESTLAAIPDDVPVIGDAKRGDLGNTAAAYAKALFETWGFDAATVNPYLGRDSLEPFLDYDRKGIFVLCRTSNPGSADLQSLNTLDNMGDALPLYQRVALMADSLNSRGNVGLVVGATQPHELKWVRECCPTMPLLIPGIGAQGGDVATAVRNGVDDRGEMAVINSSRAITYASSGRDFAEAARAAAVRARDLMRDAGPQGQL